MPASFAELPPERKLDLVRKQGLWQLVQDHLGGDWARRAELLAGVQAKDFDAWVNRLPFPDDHIHDRPQLFDGTYLLPDGHGWRVFEQERGQVAMGSDAHFATFNEAKSYAYAMVHLGGVRLRP